MFSILYQLSVFGFPSKDAYFKKIQYCYVMVILNDKKLDSRDFPLSAHESHVLFQMVLPLWRFVDTQYEDATLVIRVPCGIDILRIHYILFHVSCIENVVSIKISPLSNVVPVTSRSLIHFHSS
jgi:hypothetical protein